MRGLLAFVSPWALGGIAVWIVALAVTYNWAVPIYANVAGPGLCMGFPNCAPGSTTVTQPDTIIFALVAASIVTALMAGGVVLARRISRQ